MLYLDMQVNLVIEHSGTTQYVAIDPFWRGVFVLFSYCLATKISKANSRPREGCGLVESSSMMRGVNN